MRVLFVLLLSLSFCAALDAQPDKQVKQKQATTQGKQATSDDLVIFVQDNADASTTANKESNSKESPEWKTADQTERLADYTKSLWVVTGVIAFIAFAQFVMFWLQLSAMKKGAADTKAAAVAAGESAKAARDSVEVARESSQRQLRAYVFVGPIKISPARAETQMEVGGAQFDVSWLNTGSTPTRHLVICTNAKCFKGDPPVDFDFPDGVIKDSMLINPNGFISGQTLTIDAHMAKGISTGTYSMYIWGWADYNDVFKDTPRHRTEFYRKVSLSGNGHRFYDAAYGSVAHRADAADEDAHCDPEPYKKA